MQNTIFNWTEKSGKNFIYNSLLLVLIGIFLLPNSALASSISSENIIKLTNEERIKNNAPALIENKILVAAAETKARDILKEGLFQHNFGERKFSSWVKEAGYPYSFVGENLAMDFDTTEGIVNAWLESPTHRRNLLSPDFKEIGVAVVDGSLNGNDTVLVVQIFGTPFTATDERTAIGSTNRGISSQENYMTVGHNAITIKTVVKVREKPVVDQILAYNNIAQSRPGPTDRYENYFYNSLVLGSAELSSPTKLAYNPAAARYEDITLKNFKTLFLPDYKNAITNVWLSQKLYNNRMYYFLLGLLLLINLAAVYLHYYHSLFQRKK